MDLAILKNKIAISNKKGGKRVIGGEVSLAVLETNTTGCKGVVYFSTISIVLSY